VNLSSSKVDDIDAMAGNPLAWDLAALYRRQFGELPSVTFANARRG
jgi:hypothetical protein